MDVSFPNDLLAKLGKFRSLIQHEVIHIVLATGFVARFVEPTKMVLAVNPNIGSPATVHDLFVALQVARRFFLFEFNDVIGPDFVKSTTRYECARRSRADKVGRMKSDYMDLFAASDQVYATSKREDYDERRRFHYDIHLANEVYIIGIAAAMEIETDEERTLALLRANEMFLYKCRFLLDNLGSSGLSHETRYDTMAVFETDSRVADVLSSRLVYHDGAGVSKELFDLSNSWAEKQRVFFEGVDAANPIPVPSPSPQMGPQTDAVMGEGEWEIVHTAMDTPSGKRARME